MLSNYFTIGGRRCITLRCNEEANPWPCLARRKSRRRLLCPSRRACRRLFPPICSRALRPRRRLGLPRPCRPTLVGRELSHQTQARFNMVAGSNGCGPQLLGPLLHIRAVRHHDLARRLLSGNGGREKIPLLLHRVLADVQGPAQLTTMNHTTTVWYGYKNHLR